MARVMEFINKVTGFAIVRQAKKVQKQVCKLSDLLDDINKLDDDMTKEKTNGVHKSIR